MVTKPVVGNPNWGPTLNASLDELQGSIDTNTTSITALQGASYYRLVAASNAPTAVKNKAQYVCDGAADDVEINAAITAVQAEGGGRVQLSQGTFNLAASIAINGVVSDNDQKTVALAGVGEWATRLVPASNVNGIALSSWSQAHISDLGIQISGSGSGITATAVETTDTRSFWASSFRNLRIDGAFNASYTGWGMDMAMPWRSTFENIEMRGVRNGMRLSNQGTLQNAGDSTFSRMFIELVGDNGVAIHVSSPSNNMNQNNFSMIEAGANGNGCTGILIDGASGGASQRFWGTNLEQFQVLVNVANGESNVFDLNYVTCKTGGAGNKAFVCGSNAFNNSFSAKWVNIASAGTLALIEDNNTTSNAPNFFTRIRIENNATGTVTYTKQANTVLRDIVTFNTGNAMPAGLLQYPLSVVNNPTFTPADHGLITWTQDPATLRQTADATTSGTVYLAKVKIVDRSTIVTNILIGVSGAGVTLTAGQNFAGLYNSSGTLLSATADQTTAWGTVGLKTMALTAPQTLAVGTYYVALLSNGATAATFATGNGGSSAMNAGLTTGTARFLTGPAGQTTLPASITLGSGSPNTGSRWAALS